MLVTTENVSLPASEAVEAALTLGLPLTETRYGTHHYRRVQIGTLHVPAFAEPKWRDLGEGPSWQEKYTLTEDIPAAPILWDPAENGYCAVGVTIPVVSLLRQGGAKWGGVSIVAHDDVTPKPSTHTYYGYDFMAFKSLAGGTLFGYAATIAPGVSFRETPYKHDPSKLHTVMDLG